MKDVAAALRFVKGAVARKDYVLELTHFRIKDGHVMGSNGNLTLCHPIDLTLDIAPKAVFFEKALAAVPEGVPVALDMTAAGRLALRAGGFKVFVPCMEKIEESYFGVSEGEGFPIAFDLLGVLEDLLPFISVDASRPWAQSVLLTGHSAFATNNQIIVERWCNEVFPTPMTVPFGAVREIIRIGIEPCAMQTSDRAITFHYPNGAWLRSPLLTDPWPARAAEIVNASTDNLVDAPENFKDEVTRLASFIEDSGLIVVDGITLSTTREATSGASVEVTHAIGDGCFHIETLKKVAGIATRVDFWSKPAVFQGPRIRGVALNMRG